TMMQNLVAGKELEDGQLHATLKKLEAVGNNTPLAEIMADQARTDDMSASGEPSAEADDAPQQESARIDLSGADEETVVEFIEEATSHLDGFEGLVMALEENPEDLECVNAIFRPVHSMKGAAGFLGLHELGRFAHEGEQLLDAMRQQKVPVTDTTIDLLFEIRDTLVTLVHGVQAALDGQALPQVDHLEDLMGRIKAALGGAPVPEAAATTEVVDLSGRAESDKADDDKGEEEDEEEDRLGNIMVKEGLASPSAVSQALDIQQKKRSTRPGATTSSVIKVPTDRLDNLVDLVGELVITETQIAQNPAVQKMKSEKFGKDISQLVKITKELQEISMSLRMLPIKGLFQKMARAVRDTAKVVGKKVKMETYGEDTELDKMVIEQLGDPLLHLIRNSVDHGIESAEAREAAGKPEEGTVQLIARHEGGNIVIEIVDDGAGLDRDRILEKALANGVVTPDQNLNDSQVYNLVFKPGFSTAKEVTAVSGRGVGLDVVKRNVESLRGRVEVTSEPGKGTTFTVRLPLTMAIVDGMTVLVGQERYIIPIMSVEESLRITDEDLVKVVDKHEMVKVRGQLLRLLRLDEHFEVPDAERDLTRGLMVIVRCDGGTFAVLVDELVGQQQVVIKSLESTYVKVQGISGGAIMGDGRVGLILDIDGLYSKVFDVDKEAA
ncbi:MAG: chemotaxis protein CheA, partial [Planctomycetota bacterium]